MNRFKLMLLIMLVTTCFYAPTNAQTPTPTFELVSHFGQAINTFDWSPDGSAIVTGSVGVGWQIGDQINDKEPVVQIWSVSFINGKWVVALIDTIDGFEDTIRLVKWSPDGNKIAILENKADALHIWDVQSKQFSTEFDFISYRMHWNVDSQSLIFAAQEVSIVDAQTGQLMTSFFLPPEEQPTTDNPWWITDAQIDPTGNRLAVITPLRNENYKIVIWNLNDNSDPYIIDHVGYNMAWSPDGRLIASHTGIFDAITGQKVVDASAFTFGFLYPSWNFDGSYLATADFIFDVMANAPVALASDVPQLAATETAWSPHDNVVACLKHDRIIDLWAIVSVTPEADADRDQTVVVRDS